MTIVREAIEEAELDVYHGTQKRYRRAKALAHSGGVPAIFTTPERDFANRFGNVTRKVKGRILHYKLDTANFIDFNNPEHVARAADAYVRVIHAAAPHLNLTREDATDALLNQVSDHGINWAFRYGIEAIRAAGFSGVPLNDSDDEPSFASFDHSSLHFVGEEPADPTEW